VKSLLGAILSVVLCAPVAALADYIPPNEVQVKTDAYQPKTTNFEEGVYYYNVAWQGIPVGRAQVDVKDQKIGAEPFFHVKAMAQTASVIDVFYKLRHTSESVFHADTLKPQRFYSWQKENSREKAREISFSNDGQIRTVGTNNGAVSDSIEFHSDNFTLDPISAAFVARSLPLEQGEKLSFDVFNGKHRYLVSFLVEGLETIFVNGKQREAFRVTPSVQKLTDTEGETRLQSATVWVSADPAREVLKLESKVLVGKISAQLVSFVPQKTQVAGQFRARLADSLPLPGESDQKPNF